MVDEINRCIVVGRGCTPPNTKNTVALFVFLTVRSLQRMCGSLFPVKYVHLELDRAQLSPLHRKPYSFGTTLPTGAGWGVERGGGEGGRGRSVRVRVTKRGSGTRTCPVAWRGGTTCRARRRSRTRRRAGRRRRSSSSSPRSRSTLPHRVDRLARLVGPPCNAAQVA